MRLNSSHIESATKAKLKAVFCPTVYYIVWQLTGLLVMRQKFLTAPFHQNVASWIFMEIQHDVKGFGKCKSHFGPLG